MRFVFQRYNRCSVSEFFHRFGQIVFNLAHTFAARHEKRMVPVFFKVSVDQLFDNLESEKRNYCFGKTSGKSLGSLDPKNNLYEPCPLVACVQTPSPQEKSGGGGGVMYTGYSLSSFLP